MFPILLLTLPYLLPLTHALPSPSPQQDSLRLQDHPSPHDAYISSSGSSSSSHLPSGWVRSHCPDAVATLCANFRESSSIPSVARDRWIHAGTVCQVGVYIPSPIETETEIESSSTVAFPQQQQQRRDSETHRRDSPDRIKRDRRDSDTDADADADANDGRQHVISWWEPATEWTGESDRGSSSSSSSHESRPKQELGSDSDSDSNSDLEDTNQLVEGKETPFPSEAACLNNFLHPLATLLDSATTKDHTLDRASVNVAVGVPGGFLGGEDGWGGGKGTGTGKKQGGKEGGKGKEEDEVGVPMQRGLVRWIVMGQQTEGYDGVKSEMRRWVDG